MRGMPRYELSNKTSHKFWDITLAGAAFTVTFGKIGATGQTQIKQFPSDAAARSAYAKLIAEKTKKGYTEVGGKRKASKPATVKPAGLDGPLAAHQRTYDGSNAEAFRWERGSIRAARLSHSTYTNPDFHDGLAKVLDLLLAHPSGQALAELSLGFDGDPTDGDLQAVIDVLAKRAPATLRELAFGDFTFSGGYHLRGPKAAGVPRVPVWYSVGDLSKLWKATPALERLIVTANSKAFGAKAKLGSLRLPALRWLEIRSGGLPKASVKAIATAKLPKLEHLEVWLGAAEYGGDASIADVKTLLARRDLPELRHLGLRNAELADLLPEAIARSPLLPELTTLDLSLGCLTDEGAAKLAKHRAAFAHLAVLDVSRNYLSKSGIAALRGCANKLVSTGQRVAHDEPRHPAVAE